MKRRITISAIAYALLWVSALIAAADRNSLDAGGLFFLLFAGVSDIYKLKNGLKENRSNGTGGKGLLIAEWACATYFAFALFGRSLFMQGARFEFRFLSVVGFISSVFALYPTTYGILTIFGKIAEKERRRNDNGSLKIGLICGLVVFGTDFILTLSHYPCTMTNDSFGHWQQAIGAVAMSDYSPVAYGLLLKGLFSLTNDTTPFVYVVFQTTVLSIITGDIASFLYRRGVGFRKLVVGSFVFAIIPSTYMLLLYLSKNPLTGILCLGMVASLLQVIVEPDYYLSKPLWYIKTVLVITGVYLVRQNNVIIALPLIGFSIWFAASNKYAGKRIFIVLGSAACLVLFITGPVYRTIEYDHADKSHETIRPLISPIGCAIQQDLPLPDDLYAMAERILPAEEWKNRYDAFDSDRVTWGTPKPRYADVSLAEAFSVYMRMLVAYPDVVVKDRLDGMNCIWDIRAGITDSNKCPRGLMGDMAFVEAKLPEGLIAKSMKRIKAVTESLLEISSSEKILDLIIWKNGIYVYLFFVIAVFLAANNKRKLIWAVIPSVFILLTYALVLAWQMYFYLWFFPLSITLLMIVSIVECGNQMLWLRQSPEVYKH